MSHYSLQNLDIYVCFAQIVQKLNFVFSFAYRLDLHIKEPISSDEIVEVCGASGAGKTYLCLKMASLALLDQETAVIYIDTTNYVNHENMSLVLSVSAINTCIHQLLLTISSPFYRTSFKKQSQMRKPNAYSKHCPD